ncbi:MAG: DUF721 domain-containing protein [Candidatus Dadabacteria bacterium]|nr:MAG: DUF721 domain-containing protein [Candidatus Dadabacteria bacterium]
MKENTRPVYRKKIKRPIPVEKVLARALKKAGIENDIARYRFVLHWPEIVGEEIAKRSRPEYLRNNTLVVRTTTSAWAQELTFQKNVIVRRLNRFLGRGDAIKDIMFYVGS